MRSVWQSYQDAQKIRDAFRMIKDIKYDNTEADKTVYHLGRQERRSRIDQNVLNTFGLV